MALTGSGRGLGVALPLSERGDEFLQLLPLALCLVIAGPLIRHGGRGQPLLQTLEGIASL